MLKRKKGKTKEKHMFAVGPEEKAGVQALGEADIPELQLHLRLQTQLLRRRDRLHGPSSAGSDAGDSAGADLGGARAAHLHAQAQGVGVRLLRGLQEREGALLQGSAHLQGPAHQRVLQQEVQVSAVLSWRQGK